MTIEDRHNPRRERRLIQAASVGNERAARVLGARLQCVGSMLSALNRRMGRPLDSHDLADLIQDVMVIVLQKLHRFTGRAPLEAWVYRICAMEIRNFVRGKHRRAKRTVQPDEDRPAPPEGVGVELADEVRHAIGALASRDAQLVRMKHFDGLTFDEIAARLGLSASTLKTRYYRALRELQQVLSIREASA